MDFLYLKSVDSTNDFLKANADRFDDGTVAIAEEQTAGKGTSGRTFFSPEGGLYMSILLKRPREPVFSYITPLAALAVAHVSEKFTSKNIAVKWVNDIMADGKKVCGILCESVIEDGECAFCVVGIGVNVYLPKNGFDNEIKDIATALTDTEKPKNNDFIKQIATQIAEEFLSLYKDFSKEKTVEEYKAYSMLTGKKVSIGYVGKTTVGEVVGFNDACNIILKTDGGEKVFSSGTLRLV